MNISKTNLVRQVKSNYIIQISKYNLTILDKAIGQTFLEARKKAGYTQDELAKAAKISKPYVGTIENMRPHSDSGALPKPDRAKIIRVVEALNNKLPTDEQLNLDQILLTFGHAPKNSDSSVVPKPIFDALAREGKLDPNDEIMIADFIMRLKQNK